MLTLGNRMAKVIFENANGQTMEGEASGTIPPGWKIKGVIISRDKAPWAAKLAVWSSKYGMPTADLLDAARWLLQKDCPYCELGTQVLREIERLGPDRSETLIARILEAKKTNDTTALESIRKELWSSAAPELPQQS